jgi:prepilin signal peptidase PulO-like enzyme (type II secretory pathway)
MYLIWLGVLGLAIGSFLNVIALRYNPDKFIFNRRTLGGRSACPKCANKLNWFELVPLLSFVFLRGRCRNCKNPISFQYPLVEIFSALIFLFVSLFIHSPKFLILAGSLNLGGAEKMILSVLFILVFLTLLLVFFN